MEVTLSSVSKSFGREVVFRDLSHTFERGSRTAILGANGSGKSTLLQLVAGALMPTSGTVDHALNGSPMAAELVYRHVSIAAPYMNLYEDLTLRETIEVHERFKPLRRALTPRDLAAIVYLDGAWDKPVRNFSSGMKQRLKLALAILSDTSLLLLDEPASNLDAQAVTWMQQLLADHLDRRTVLVASNRQAVEVVLCEQTLEIGPARN